MLSAVEKKSDQVYRWLLAYIDENKFSGNQRRPSDHYIPRSQFRQTRQHAFQLLPGKRLMGKRFPQ